MDRTTLTRNLELLIKRHLVRSEEGEDRRTRQVGLIKEGEQALGRAWPLWQEAVQSRSRWPVCQLRKERE